MTRRQSVTTTTELLVDPPRPSIRRIGMPPGPSGLPLVGQAFRLRFDLVGLLQDAATYGDVSTVSAPVFRVSQQAPADSAGATP